MSKLDRFRRIEPRGAPASHDPFAPPPERPLELQVALDDAAEVEKVKAERRARAEAELAQHEQETAAQRAELAATEHVKAVDIRDALHAIARLGPYRLPVIAGIVIASVLLVGVAAPLVWLLAPVSIALLLVSYIA